MNIGNFNTKLRTLSSMVGSFESDALFVDLYTDLLQDVQSVGVGRFSMLQRLKTLLMLQLEFMTNEYLSAPKDDEPQPAMNEIGWAI